MTAGLAAGIGCRIMWGIDPDLWQYAGCFLLWILRRWIKPKAGMETAALAGLAMLPRIFASLSGNPLELLHSFAALPVAMLFAAVLRHDVDAMSQGTLMQHGQERFCCQMPVLVLLSGLGCFRIGPVNLGQAGAVTAAVLFALITGPVYGVMGGLFSGMALALGGQDSRMVLALCVAGLLCGLPPAHRQHSSITAVSGWLICPAM